MPHWQQAAFGHLLNVSPLTGKSNNGVVYQSTSPIQVAVCDGRPRVVVPRRIHYGLKCTRAEVHFVYLEPTVGMRLLARDVARRLVRSKSHIRTLAIRGERYLSPACGSIELAGDHLYFARSHRDSGERRLTLGIDRQGVKQFAISGEDHRRYRPRGAVGSRVTARPYMESVIGRTRIKVGDLAPV